MALKVRMTSIVTRYECMNEIAIKSKAYIITRMVCSTEKSTAAIQIDCPQIVLSSLSFLTLYYL
jgi:hypothetical protein